MSLHTTFQEFPHDEFQIRPETEHEQQTVSVSLLVPLRIQSADIVSRTGVPILIVVTALKVVSFNPGISTSNGSNVLLAKYGLRHRS